VKKRLLYVKKNLTLPPQNRAPKNPVIYTKGGLIKWKKTKH
jgi:hypothetical protein